jgi:hypothetical protein
MKKGVELDNAKKSRCKNEGIYTSIVVQTFLTALPTPLLI